ncbi:hypothetical protein ACWKWU_02890 [Chitinophaga lutea]
MKTHTWKSIGAIVAGFATVVVLSILTDFILESAGIFPPPGNGLYITWMLLLALAYRTVYTVIGGYVTAALAPSRPMRHARILGIVGTIAGIAGVFASLGMSPLWYPIALALLALPSTLLGGWLRWNRRPKPAV